MKNTMRNDGTPRTRPTGNSEIVTSAMQFEDINFNRMDANDLYLMSSEEKYFRISRQIAMLSGEIRDLLNYPGRENVRVLYFYNLSDKQIIDVIMCMDMMSRILKSYNVINLLPQLQHTTEPLQINLQTPVLELQRSVFNHSRHAEFIPESVKASLLLKLGIEI